MLPPKRWQSLKRNTAFYERMVDVPPRTKCPTHVTESLRRTVLHLGVSRFSKTMLRSLEQRHTFQLTSSWFSLVEGTTSSSTGPRTVVQGLVTSSITTTENRWLELRPARSQRTCKAEMVQASVRSPSNVVKNDGEITILSTQLTVGASQGKG